MNNKANMNNIDTAQYIPEISNMPLPLRAESLRQLEAASLRRNNNTVSAPTSPTVTLHHSSNDRHTYDNDSELDEVTSVCTPPTTTDESFDDEEGEHFSHSGLTEQPVSRLNKMLAPPKEGCKKVLVTGGGGFVGSHVADYLLTRGDSVILVDEFNDYYDVTLKRSNITYLQKKHGCSRLRVIEADICDASAMEHIFVTEHPRHIVHMAARAGVRPSIDDPFVYIHSNILGTTRLLDLARLHGNDCFVWASSSSVYGGSPNEEFSESDLVDNPVSPYAATKKACELMTYTYHSLYGMNISGLRFFTVYGPRGRPDMAPFKFVDCVSRGREIQQYGDGTSSRDYTYIDDVVDGVVRAVDRPLGYQIFNLGNGSPYRLCDFIALVEKNVGKRALIRVLPDQPGDVPRTCANISKASELLGYQPKIGFEEGIRRTVEWYKEWQAGQQQAQQHGKEPGVTSRGCDTAKAYQRDVLHSMSTVLAAV